MNVTDDAVRLLQQRLDTIQHITQTGDWEWSLEDNHLRWSRETCRIFGIEGECDHPTIESLLIRVHPKDRSQLIQALRQAKNGTPFDLKHRIERPDGHFCVVRSCGSVLMGTHSTPETVIGTVQDITRQEQQVISDQVINRIIAASLNPVSMEEIFSEILGIVFSIPWISIESKGAIFLNDPHNHCLSLASQIGLSDHLLTHCASIRHGTCLCGLAAETREVVFASQLDERHTVRFEGMHQHGHYCIPILLGDLLLGVLNLYVPDGHNRCPEEERVLTTVANTLASLIDRKRKEHQLELLARYDSLTGLPNWITFTQQIEQWIHSRPQPAPFAILFIDLDHFKAINDILGHKAGDALLELAAKRLQQCLRKEDFLGRKSGDEFVAGIRIDTSDRARVVAQKIVTEMSYPFNLEGREGRIGASIGIAMVPHDGVQVEALIKKADTAMYYAKKQGKNGFAFFSDEMQSFAIKHQRLAALLQRCVPTMEGFEVYYQPQVNIESGELVGVEALLRWNRPDNQERVPPDLFITIAEEANLMISIGEWVLRESCRQAARWKAMGFPTLRLGVNCSPKQFRDPHFPDTVQRVLEETLINPRNLELEITETAIEGREEEQLADGIRRIAEKHIAIALDDFGTGQSSLKRLRTLPIRTLKIDKSFINGFLSAEEDCAIVTGTVGLALNLGKVVIAEGVESETQRKALLELGCDELQGFYFSPAVNAAELEKLLLQNLFIIHHARLKDSLTHHQAHGWHARDLINDLF
ncbi:MAG: EAL domain-containing protein [Magnetococcales bacterium]|nr:EAL domain-containing protein [Magnetococcales bacterium]